MTIIEGFVNFSNKEIKNLLKELKSKCSSGGTYKKNKIEIQGDHVEKIKEILKKRGLLVK